MQLSITGGRLIISSDGVWDALSPERAVSCSQGLPPDAAATQVVKVMHFILIISVAIIAFLWLLSSLCLVSLLGSCTS